MDRNQAGGTATMNEKQQYVQFGRALRDRFVQRIEGKVPHASREELLTELRNVDVSSIVEELWNQGGSWRGEGGSEGSGTPGGGSGGSSPTR